MPKFRYMGNHEATSMGGYFFPRGKGVDVEGLFAEKLANNSHFEEVKPGRPKARKDDGEDGE